jgi:AcrR family transcriptional regulator
MTAKAAGPAPDLTETVTDGRRLRSADSRRRIVEALMQLVEAGDLEPSAETVADRAGVGLRSVFRHFKDMEGLRREMNVIVEARLRGIVEPPLPGVTWQQRLESLIGRRSEAFETVMPYRRAANAQRHRSDLIQAKSVELNRVLRAALVGVLPAGIDEDTFDALDLVMSLDSWIRMRTDQGLGPARARQVMTHAVQALLAGR